MAYVISRAFDYAVVGRGRGVRSRSRSPSHAAVREESPSEFEETALQRRLCAVQVRKAESAEPISGPAVGPRGGRGAVPDHERVAQYQRNAYHEQLFGDVRRDVGCRG